MVEAANNLEEYFGQAAEARLFGGCAECGSDRVYAEPSDAEGRSDTSGPSTAVRFGYMRFVGEFAHPPDMKFTCGAKVVIQTQRGIEIGEQMPLTCSGCQKSVPYERIKEWVKCSGEDTFIFSAGRILREATAADLAEQTHIQAGCREKRDFAQRVASEHNLPLKVVECECPFGGERIIFYFTAAERIDFRSMVKDLAREYRTRIEMRQIGARDEARLLADYETCGQEVCCKSILKTLKPISMRMAKLQKATLDPSQVSGRCGRLKCCLRYEHASYEELDAKLPRNGLRIRATNGEGVIVNRQVLTQLVQIRTDKDILVTVAAEDITDVNVTPTSRRVDSPEIVHPAAGTPEQPVADAPPRGEPMVEPASAGDGSSPGVRGRGESRRPRAPRAPKGAQRKSREAEHPQRKRRRRKRRRTDNAGGASNTDNSSPGAG